MKIQAPLGYFPAVNRRADHLENLSPSGQLALQKLSEIATQRKGKDEAGAQPATPPPTVGSHIDIRV